jgi:phosphoribosylformylglycinamidine cyclo-ligase
VSDSKRAKSDRYKDAGVDIDLAQTLLKKVKAKIASTKRPEVLAPVGGFGGLFQLDLSRYQKPVLVASVDGVGTKLMIANMMEKHDGVGFDIVNHCINDIAVQGAEPLYFMDYLGIGKLRSPLYEVVLGGLADACAAQNVTLLGGETAEMPGMYGNDYDLVGSITGVVEKDRLITGERIHAGEVVIALASNGLHTNGYSLARRVLFEETGYTVDSKLPELGGESLGEALLKPHTCYWPAVKRMLDSGLELSGLAHITGGGLYDNVPRILPEGVGIVCDQGCLPIPGVFEVIRQAGNIGLAEMYRVFNMGLGMLWFVPEADAEAALAHCAAVDIQAAVVGRVVDSDVPVSINGIDL